MGNRNLLREHSGGAEDPHIADLGVQKTAYWRNPEAYRQNRIKSYRKQKGQADKK